MTKPNLPSNSQTPKPPPPKTFDPDRYFWPRVLKTDTCWIWTGFLDKKGYGHLGIGNRRVALAHRYSYFLAHGEWPEPCCLHSCDVRCCVNPDHLRAGTDQDNSDDKFSRGRDRRLKGSANAFSKYTEAQALEVKGLLRTNMSKAAIARFCGVNYHFVYDIYRNRTWTHI